MRYRVRISEMRYGEAIVESKNEEEAKEVAYLNGIDWFDHEITDMTVEPEPENNRTFMVVEVCPHCMSEIEMRWNTDTQGFKAFCPVCGKRLMLCDECLHTQDGDCDYDSELNSCKFSREKEAKECYIIIHSNYAEGSDAYAFANMESARRSMKADVDVELRNLTDAGYRDIVKEESEDEASVYVRGLDIYYEWSIIPSHLEGE